MKSLMSVAGFVLVACTAVAQPSDDWNLLGAREVTDRTENDFIALPGNRDFRQIRLCVLRNPVEIKDLDVHFKNGGRQEVAVRERVGAGNCTRNIDLEGGQRDITRIDMRYEEASAKRARATVRVFGR